MRGGQPESRRSLLQQLGYSAGHLTIARRSLPALLPLAVSVSDKAAAAARKTCRITDYGAVGDGRTDCTSAIRAAVADASDPRPGAVVIPQGEFAYSDSIYVGDNIAVLGEQGATLIARTERQAFVAKGVNIVFRALRIKSTPRYRSHDEPTHGIAGVNSTNLLIAGCVIDGASGGGIYLESCSDFLLQDNRVTRTLADTIHITGRSERGVVTRNICQSGGDDGIAVVSYAPSGLMCRDIAVIGNEITDGKARGIAVAGGEHVQVSNNRIHNTEWAGILIASDETYETYGNTDIWIESNDLSAVNRRSGQGTHACITIVGRPGRSALGQRMVENGNRGIRLVGNQIRGDGRGGVRADRFTQDITVAATSIAATGGWGIFSEAFGASFIGNWIERAGGGILIGAGCAGGKTEVIGNEIEVANEWRGAAIAVEATRVSEMNVRSNCIRSVRNTGLAIHIANTQRVRRAQNVLNGEWID
jgi:parallel beta-helix repeat protein